MKMSNTRLIIIFIFILSLGWSGWYWMSNYYWTLANLATIPPISPAVQQEMNTPGGEPASSPTSWFALTKTEASRDCKEQGGVYDERMNMKTLIQWPICYLNDTYYQIHEVSGTVIGCSGEPVCFGTSTAPQ